jgi:peptidoglycan hydrolase-like protein with peptidoglycan-binding domain
MRKVFDSFAGDTMKKQPKIVPLVALVMATVAAPGLRAEAFRFLIHENNYIVLADFDWPPYYFRPPLLECGSQGKTWLTVEVYDTTHKVGAPATAVLFADRDAFVFRGIIHGRVPLPGTSVVPPNLRLPTHRTAALVSALTNAKTLSWSLPANTRQPWPTSASSRAIRTWMRGCGFKLDPIFAARRALIATGFLNEIPLGSSDSATRDAISAWQRSRRLAASGKLDAAEKNYLAAEGDDVERHLDWKSYEDPQGRFEIGWNGFSGKNAEMELGVDIVDARDLKHEFDNYYERLAETSPRRTVLFSEKTAHRYSFGGMAANGYYWVWVERRMYSLAALHLWVPKSVNGPYPWHRIFLLMAESFEVKRQ